MITYNFDGCALGMKNQEGEPLKKPWTVATNHAGIGRTLSKFQCKCERRHAPGRGIALKRTEEYTFRMTDAIHKAVIWQHTPLKTACCALFATFRFVVDAMLARAIQMAKACAVAGRPAILERITLWEGVVNTLKGAIAVITWDEPQVLLREMEGCRLPIANIVEPTLSGGNAEGAYDVLAEVFRNTPDGYLAMCSYPPGGEVDLLIVSDSSLALVPDPNAGKTSCFSGGDLLKPWGDVRGIYTKMLWGKGLNNMVQYIPEALDDIESANRVHGRPVLPVLVIVGWAGNDVFGEGGYRGVHWIHRAAYNKSAADREVTANWCERQRARVNKSVEDLGELKRTEPRIADIVVVGNADADLFALPTSYNETMRVHVRALREDHSIQTVDTTLMLARTTRYDKVHLLDDAINRKYMANFLQAVAECHLAFMKLVSIDDHLRTLPRIESVEEQRNYPNLPALRVAYQMEIESNVASPQELPARPDMEKVMLEADLEILNWVLQAEESATATADREVEPWMREIAEEDQAIEPMHLDNADSDDEIIKVQALTTEDRLEARRKGFSEEPDQEWQDATYGGDDEKEEFKGWDLVEESKRPPGVVASDPVNDAEDELDIDDLVTEASLEIVEEEEFHDVDEGQAEGIDDDDDDDMAVISKVSSMQSAGKDAQGDLEPMDVDEKGDKMAQSSSSVKTWKTDISSVASAGATPSDPTSKLKPKAKPAKKAMPKRLKVVDEGHGPSAEQFDTSKFTTAQDLVWIEPDNMVGVPVRKVDYGRLSSISHAMSDYLRGHRMFHRRPSPEIRRTDLSMDFKALVRHLQGDFAHLREEEVLMVVRNSPMRRFRIQVNGLSSGKLKWTPIRIRAIQGHRAFVPCAGGGHGFDDQSHVHVWPGVRSEQGRWPSGSSCILCDAGRLACLGSIPACDLSHVWSGRVHLDCAERPHPRRLSLQDGQSAQLFQLHSALEGRDEKVARNAGREADRHRFWHRDADAARHQAFRNWRGDSVAGLGDEPCHHERIWYAVWWIFLHQSGVRQPSEDVPGSAQGGEAELRPRRHPGQPHGDERWRRHQIVWQDQGPRGVRQTARLLCSRPTQGREEHCYPGGWSRQWISAGRRLHRCQNGSAHEHRGLRLSSSRTAWSGWRKLA